MIRSITSREVSEEANEKGFPETAAAESNSAEISSSMIPAAEGLFWGGGGGGARALEI